VKRIIFDCDPGVDDALALLLALNSQKVEIEAITTVAGNVQVSQTTLNVCRLLEYLDVAIPVAKGADRPMKASRVDAKSFHGKDGLGDSNLLPPTATIKPDSRSAVDLILDAVESGVKTIVATGPLTNIASAFLRDDSVMSKVDELIMMGGAFNIAGNVDSMSEFNFYCDPHAADYVLQKTSVRKMLVPLNVTEKVLLTSAHLKSLNDTRISRLVKSIVKNYQKAYANFGLQGNPLHDPLAMSHCIDRSMLQFTSMFVKVETEGIYTRGVCVAEQRAWIKSKPNVEVALNVKQKQFINYFLETISK
jgi:inosine-uridine nucleoside N-ribohydrolase